MLNANNKSKRKHLYHKQIKPRAICHNIKKLRELFKVPQFKYVYKNIILRMQHFLSHG